MIKTNSIKEEFELAMDMFREDVIKKAKLTKVEKINTENFLKNIAYLIKKLNLK